MRDWLVPGAQFRKLKDGRCMWLGVKAERGTTLKFPSDLPSGKHHVDLYEALRG